MNDNLRSYEDTPIAFVEYAKRIVNSKAVRVTDLDAVDNEICKRFACESSRLTRQAAILVVNGWYTEFAKYC